MAYANPGDISAILNAFGQLGQSNALMRQRKDAAEASRASTMGALGGVAGGIAGAYFGGPMGAAAGSAAGSRLLGGDKVSGAQTISQAGQAYQMGQGQQQYEQSQADRAAVAKAGDYLNPQPQYQTTTVNTPGVPGQQTAFPEEGGAMFDPSTPATSRGEMVQTQGAPNVRGAIGELFKAGQIGPAISLMAAQQKNQPDPFTLNEGQGRYDAQGNLIIERPKPGGGDDPGKTEFERSIALEADQAVQRGDIKSEKRPEFMSNLRRQKLGRTETTATGGKIEGIDVKAAIKAVNEQAAGPSLIPSKIGEKPFTPEQAAKVGMINSAIKTHANVSQAIRSPDGGYDRKMIAAMSLNVPFTEGRQRRQEYRDAIEARLRAESGAAVPDSEVSRAEERFMPSPLDSDDAIASKTERFKEWLADTSWLIKEGRAEKPETESEVHSVKTPADASKLKPGTRYKTPGGRIFVR